MKKLFCIGRKNKYWLKIAIEDLIIQTMWTQETYRCCVISEYNTYRVPLRFLCNIGLVNHQVKLDTKIICTLETDLLKLFESGKKVKSIAGPDAKIIWDDAPFIQFEQFRLNNNFRQYLETSFLAKKVSQIGIKKQLFKSLTS